MQFKYQLLVIPALWNHLYLRLVVLEVLTTAFDFNSTLPLYLEHYLLFLRRLGSRCGIKLWSW
jgi:hypothetical protein